MSRVTARVARDVLDVSVRDDGVGGARLLGTGLLGLRDRLAATTAGCGSRAPSEGGTLVAASIPLDAARPER